MHLFIVRHFVAIVMLLIFLVQLTAVSTVQLDRWKGMGMGMFSSFRERSIAQLDVQLNGEWYDVKEEVRTWYPVTVQNFLQMPTQFHEERLVQKMNESQLLVSGSELYIIPRYGLHNIHPQYSVMSNIIQAQSDVSKRRILGIYDEVKVSDIRSEVTGIVSFNIKTGLLKRSMLYGSN